MRALKVLRAAALLPCLGAAARAQQVFINSLWVSNASECIGPVAPANQYFCPGPPNANCPTPGQGNISNNPRIEFDQAASASCLSGGVVLPSSSTTRNVCNSRLFLCGNVGYSNRQTGNTAFALDYVSFELFKFGAATNPLDPQSAPPLRTFFVDRPGSVPANSEGTVPSDGECTGQGLSAGCGYCVLWDGSFNVLGDLGKLNGTYGFRTTVNTNQTGASGNINITQTRAYPGGATLDASCSSLGTVDQKPITVDVTNVHAVRTTPTVVGSITGVAAEPYNITYRLSKDATMFLTIEATSLGVPVVNPVVRTVVPGLPRVGEGTPDGTLQNGDAWNGRHDNGGLMPSGLYLATLQAFSSDQFGFDLSAAVTRQISLDPLQITDILVQPLTSQATSLAVLTYTLTEPATSFVDIYPPGVQFCNTLNDVNGAPDQAEPLPPKDFAPRLGDCAGPAASPLRRIVEQKDFRRPVISFWDGRDSSGGVMPDGDYVFVLYAALPSPNGRGFLANASDRRIWTSTAKSGFLSVARGLVQISQVGPASTVIGSSPAVAGINPFVFTYSLSRDALVSLVIFDSSGLLRKRSLVQSQVRPGNFLNREIWPDGAGDDGLILSSGVYLVQLSAADPFFPSKVSTTTAMFPLDLFRITDLAVTPLLTGSSDTVSLSYQLSQGMHVAWNIYPPGTVIAGSSATWPPCGGLSPGACGQTLNEGNPVRPLITVSGMRPGRLRITEFWDGRDANGLFVPDGAYVFTLAAKSTTTPSFFATDRVFGTLTVARGAVVFPLFRVRPTVPALFNSSQAVTLPPYAMEYSLTRQSSVTIRILDTRLPPSVVRTLISGQMREGGILNEDFWDARDDRGGFVRPGFYTVQAVAEDLASVLASGSTVQQTISVDPLRIYDVAISPLLKESPNAVIAYQVSETMKTAVKIFRPGTLFDPNGNPIPPESVSLVRRIVGVRPARTEISEVWDGRDEKLALLPDGDYIFRIVGSTDANAIDTITGNVSPGASLAEDLVVAQVPVVRGESLDPARDFEENTFVYPNPVSGAQATFHVFVPFQSDVSIKLFNIAGELVYERGFPDRPRSSDNGPITFVWNKVNSSNRRLAPGVYFLMVREVETKGGGNVLQTVKKVLLQ